MDRGLCNLHLLVISLLVISLLVARLIESSLGDLEGAGSRPMDRSDRDEHGGTRTPDTQNRNLMLYPTELHAQTGRSRNEPRLGSERTWNLTGTDGTEPGGAC